MKTLEDIYEENHLFPVRRPQSSHTPRTKTQSIEKIQGLFSSLTIELEKLRDSFNGEDESENGFNETVQTILNEIETPYTIFDQTFFASKDRF